MKKALLSLALLVSGCLSDGPGGTDGGPPTEGYVWPTDANVGHVAPLVDGSSCEPMRGPWELHCRCECGTLCAISSDNPDLAVCLPRCHVSAECPWNMRCSHDYSGPEGVCR